MDQSTCVSPSSTSTALGPRPAFPPQATPVRHLSHDLPTAPRGPVSMTRVQVTAALNAEASDDDRWLPQLPGQRRPSEKPTIPGKRQPTDHVPAFDDTWGRPSAWAAFGDGAA